VIDLTTLILGFISAIGFASIFAVDPISIKSTQVPGFFESQGYTGDTVGKMFRERLRHIGDVVGTIRGDEFSHDYVHQTAIDEFAKELQLDTLVDASRDFLGLRLYAISGLVTYTGNTYKYTLKVQTPDEQTFFVTVQDEGDIPGLINEMAESFLARTDPYILAQYYRRVEAPSGQFTKTIPMLDHCIRVLPSNQTMWPILVRGSVHLRLGEYDQAIQRYQQVTELDPSYAEAYALWGKALIGKGESDAGLAMMRKAVELAPNDPYQKKAKKWASVYAHLGDELVKRGQDEEAREIYIQGIEMMPVNPWPKAGLGKLYLRHKQYDPAIDLLRAALHNHPEKEKVREQLDLALAGKFGLAL